MTDNETTNCGEEKDLNNDNFAYALLYYLCYQFAPSLGTLASGTSGLSAVVSITAGRSF